MQYTVQTKLETRKNWRERDHFIKSVRAVLLSVAPPFAGEALAVAATVLFAR